MLGLRKGIATLGLILMVSSPVTRGASVTVTSTPFSPITLNNGEVATFFNPGIPQTTFRANVPAGALIPGLLANSVSTINLTGLTFFFPFATGSILTSPASGGVTVKTYSSTINIQNGSTLTNQNGLGGATMWLFGGTVNMNISGNNLYGGFSSFTGGISFLSGSTLNTTITTPQGTAFNSSFSGDASSSGVTFDLQSGANAFVDNLYGLAGLTLNLISSGSFTGGFNANTYNASIQNSGSVNATNNVTCQSGSINISNSGSHNGSLTSFNGAFVTITGSGSLIGNVSANGHSVISLQGSGSVTGSVSAGGGAQVNITNAGNINGNLTGGAISSSSLTLTGSSTSNKVGSVNFGNSSTVTHNSAGIINGNVSTGTSSTVSMIGTGRINGSITTGAGSNITRGGTGNNGINITGNIAGNGSTLNVTTSWQPTNTLLGGRVDYAITGINNLNVSGGTFIPPAMSVASTITLSNVNTTLTLNNQMSGVASTTVGAGTILNLNTTNALNTSGTLINNGTINVNSNWTKSNSITNTGSITLNNSSNFTTTGAFAFNNGTMSGNGSYTNSGGIFAFSKAGDVNALSFTGAFTNNGTLNVNESLTRSGTFSSAGDITIAAGRTFTLGGTSTQIGGNMTGGGNLVNNGNYTMSGTSTIQITGAKTNNGTFTQSGGTISGGTFTNVTNATYNFNSGTFNAILTNQANALVSISGAMTTNNGSSSAGTINLSSTGSLTTGTFTNTGPITNNGSLAFGGISSNSNLITNNSTLAIGAGFTNTGTITNGSASNTTITGAVSGAGTMNTSGVLSVNSGGSIAGQTFNVTSVGTVGGTIKINGTGSIGVPIVGAVSNVNTALIIGESSAVSNYVPGGTISNIRTITVNTGSVMNSTVNISGVNTAFNVNSNATATFTAGTLSGTGQFNNSGTVSFNGTSSISSIPVINMATGSTLNFNSGTKTLNNTNIVGVNGNVSTNLLIGPTTACETETNGLIQDIRFIRIYSGSILRLNNGGQILTTNGANNLQIDGTLDIDDGSFFTINSSDTITGSGSIINGGVLTINGSNLTLGGDFTNESSGVFAINGTPTLTFNGTNFINQGQITATFNASNSLPFIDVRNATNVNLSEGTIIIGYQRNYIAAGNYVLLSAASPPTIGGYFTPQFTPGPGVYISSMNLETVGNNLVVSVVRDGFGAHAQTLRATQIGNFLEFIGSNNPTQAQLNLLNALEQIQTDEELTQKLEELMPADYIQQVNLQIQEAMLGSVFMRLAQQRMVADYGNLATFGFNAGDQDPENAFWVRPFWDTGHQRPIGEQVGYKSNTNGVIIGLDRQIGSQLMMGFAGNYANSKAVNTANILTTTSIRNYQATLYGTYKTKSNAYFDGLISAGINNYHAVRNVSLPGFNENAYSKYQSQQFTAKVLTSKNYGLGYLQFSPQASAQYSFIRQLAYTETGAGPYNVISNPNNTNLFRLGAGAKFSLPMSTGKMLSIPGVYAVAYVDVAGGAQVTNTQFITGGPIITSNVQPGRLLYNLGASYEFSLKENLQLILNYDVQWRNAYNGQDFYINLRYLF